MEIDGTPYRTIWVEEPGRTVGIIDQTKLPHRFTTVTLSSMEEAARAIADMLVRGAPLIGATAAYGMAMACNEDASDAGLRRAYDRLYETRPTAVNLRWALDDMRGVLTPLDPGPRRNAAYRRAAKLCNQDVAINRAIGKNGLGLIQDVWQRTGKTVNLLTHCNAGALATGARRVVLKRPPSAAELPGPLAARHAGKLARYDVYHGEAP